MQQFFPGRPWQIPEFLGLTGGGGMGTYRSVGDPKTAGPQLIMNLAEDALEGSIFN